jgi:hypothetical protein
MTTQPSIDPQASAEAELNVVLDLRPALGR